MSAAIIDAARETLALDIYPVPVKVGTKRPPMRDWPNLRVTLETVPEHFSNGSNIGWLLGITPRPIADVDLDCPEALAVSTLISGPKTQRIAGHKSNPNSHYFFELPDECDTTKFQDPLRKKDEGKKMIVELRGKGCQTIVPPSRHADTDEIYEWTKKGSFGTTTYSDLLRWASKVAAAGLLVRYWNARVSGRLALIGMLARAKWPEEETREFVKAVIKIADPDDYKEVSANVTNCYHRVEGDAEAFGFPKLIELLGDNGKLIVETVAKWLCLERPESDHRGERFIVEKGELCAVHWEQKGRGEEKEWVRTLEPLANFSATIVKQVVLDDGVTTVHAHVVNGTLWNGRKLPEVRVLATEFPTMAWVAKEWTVYGASLRPGLGLKDRLRAGIEFLSSDPSFEHVYTHTGWVKLETGWAFLHAGGALNGVAQVDLGPPELSWYKFPDDGGAGITTPAEAMRDSLALLDVAPDAVTVPLWAGMYRAPLASLLPLNFSIWSSASTGNLKTTLAALFLCHFGDFNLTRVPANWSSTANALEKRAFIMQDVPLVIDEYVPATSKDARELEEKAARLIRAQGNLTGRARLRADLTERAGNPPRGLIISTGEGRPLRESLTARTIVIEPDRDAVDLEKLSAAQKRTGYLRYAMRGYIEWLAPQIDTLKTELAKLLESERAKLTEKGSHLRVPETIASVKIGAEMAVRYAIECGALNNEKAVELRKRVDDALAETVKEHAKRVAEENPARRYLRVLAAALAAGQAIMAHKDSDIFPEAPIVGWQDFQYIYLLPEVAHKTVVEFCARAGEPFNILDRDLRKSLDKLGVLIRDDGSERFTRNVRISSGGVKNVLQLSRASAQRELEDGEFPNDPPRKFKDEKEERGS